MPSRELGRIYEDGAVIFRESDPGDCMYYISKGKIKIRVLEHEQKTADATLIMS